MSVVSFDSCLLPTQLVCLFFFPTSHFVPLIVSVTLFLLQQSVKHLHIIFPPEFLLYLNPISLVKYTNAHPTPLPTLCPSELSIVLSCVLFLSSSASELTSSFQHTRFSFRSNALPRLPHLCPCISATFTSPHSFFIC